MNSPNRIYSSTTWKTSSIFN